MESGGVRGNLCERVRDKIGIVSTEDHQERENGGAPRGAALAPGGVGEHQEEGEEHQGVRGH